METLKQAPRFGQPGPSETKDNVQSEIAALKSEFSELAASVTAAAKASAAGLQDTANDRADELRVAIRSNPTQAALISAGIGFVIGLLVSR